jgi:hypothetical protein
MTETDLLTQRKYASYCRCSVRTLDRERAEGRGCPYLRLGSRILYRRIDIDRYLQAQVRGGDARDPDSSTGQAQPTDRLPYSRGGLHTLGRKVVAP